MKSEYDQYSHRCVAQSPYCLCVDVLQSLTIQGGEAAIKTSNDSILKARGASISGVVLVQDEQARRARCHAHIQWALNRVSVVTSYCFPDDDVDVRHATLKSVDIFNNMPTLYNIYLEYKLQLLHGKLDLTIQRIQQQGVAGNLS